MNIAIASDHAGYEYKEQIKTFLGQQGHQVFDFGTHSAQMCDYPDYIRPAAEAVAQGKFDFGIVLGGSGNGEAIVSNKVPNIRCAVVWSNRSAQLAKQHNNANMISVGQRMMSIEEALEIIQTYMAAEFEGGRHAKRIGKIKEATDCKPG